MKNKVNEMLKGPFSKGIHVIEQIEKHNHKAFFVGGSVRDYLLNREIHDIDIATSATPDMIQSIFKKVIPIGIDHGTVLVRYEGLSFEVTTFREEGTYSDQRRPDYVHYIEEIDGDLRRRDFTINALAMDKHGEIIDLFNGREDLKKKVIRTVGSASDRFTEDPLRIVRALRFSSELGFSIDTHTFIQMRALKQMVETLAVERITSEFTKFFAGTYVNEGFNHLLKSEVYKHLPVFKEHPKLVNDVPTPLYPLHSFGEVIALFHYLDPMIPERTWAKVWKCSNHIQKEAILLGKALHYYRKKGLDNWLVYHLTAEHIESFIRLIKILFPKNELKTKTLMELYRCLPIKAKTDLAINGNDLTRFFPKYKKGAWIGKMLEKIEKEVIFHRLENEKNEIKEWIKCNPPVIS